MTSNSLPMSNFRCVSAVGGPFEDHRAEHRAAVVDEVEEHRTPVVEVLAQPHDLAGLVAELEIERDPRVELLGDGDVGGAVLLREERQREQREDQERASLSASAGRPAPAGRSTAASAVRRAEAPARAPAVRPARTPALRVATPPPSWRPAASSLLRWGCARRRAACPPSRSCAAPDPRRGACLRGPSPACLAIRRDVRRAGTAAAAAGSAARRRSRDARPASAAGPCDLRSPFTKALYMQTERDVADDARRR